MKSLSPNTKIDFRKLLATVQGLPNSTNRFGSGDVKTHNYSYKPYQINYVFIIPSLSIFWAMSNFIYFSAHAQGVL